jgi:MFS transporter, DHA2 family, multidrug resistance protein
MVSTTAAAVPDAYRGTDKLIFGIVVLAVITFWLFAQTTLNVAPTMRDALWISESLINIAVSITVPKDDRRGSVNV